MFKMLTRLYLILLVTYGLALYVVPEAVLKLFDERNFTYNMEEARGPLKLIQQRFQAVPEATWGDVERALQKDFASLQLRLIGIDDVHLSTKEVQDLTQGRNAVRMGFYGELGTALTPLSKRVAVEVVWPDPPVDINAMYWLMNILIGAALLGCLLIWVRPHWRDLQRLKLTAMRLGQGELGARTQISQRSNIGELAQVFDRMAEDIEALLTQRQDLLNAVSHELRTPLSRLEFGMALIRSDELAPSTRIRLDQMIGHVRELDSLVGELLSYTRLQSPYERAHLEPVHTAAFLDSVLIGFIEEQERRGIDLLVDTTLAPDLFGFDPKLTARALQNLAGNALRYCQHQVRVSAITTHERGLVIRIEDDGIGIPAGERVRIFEPFYRMDRSRDRATGGFGLGLAISRRAIQCQGGDVTVDASPLGGSRFDIHLPPTPPRKHGAVTVDAA